MIKGLSLENFKNFNGKYNIDLKPITLIYGANSSGKSSLMQSMLLLKQTIEQANDPGLTLLSKGNYIDLGGYKEFINKHDETKDLSIKLVLDAKNQSFLKELTGQIKAKNIGLEFRFAQNTKLFVKGISLFIDDYDQSFCELSPYELSKDTDQYKQLFPSLLDDYNQSSDYFKIDNFNWEHPLWKTIWENFKSVKNFQNIKKELSEKIETLKANKEEILETIRKNQQIIEEKVLNEAEIKDLQEWQKLLEEREVKEIDKTISFFSEKYEYIKGFNYNKFKNEIKKLNQSHIYNLKNFLPKPVLNETNFANLANEKNLYNVYDPNMDVYLDIDVNLSILFIRLSREIENFLKSLIYLGPLRDYPERYYIFSGNIAKYVGKSGQMVPDILFEDQSILEEVNRVLNILDLGYELKITKFNDEKSSMKDVFALKLVDLKTDVDVSIPDVGFGISQVLPIVVQSMLSKNRTILIEQPEIHLHPRLQGELGSMFSECIKSPRNNSFIIETHSENLILRLQKLIRKGDISHDDVSIIYVDKDSNGSICTKLRLDEDGDFIDEWPHGFFEESFDEMFG